MPSGPKPELLTPPPVPINARRIVTVGTVLWLAAFVVLLCVSGRLGEHGHRIWLWTALAGTVLGVPGLLIMRRHRALGRTI